MQKLMMQCHIKDNRLHVPEYIIPMHLCKVESRFVKKTESLYLSVYLHNLTTNIKTVNSGAPRAREARRAEHHG